MWHQNNRRANTSRISKPARECGRNKIFRGRNWDGEQNVRFGGDTLSGGAIITGLASKVGLGGGVAYVYISN